MQKSEIREPNHCLPSQAGYVGLTRYPREHPTVPLLALLSLFSITVCTLESKCVAGSKSRQCWEEIWTEFNRICQEL